MAARNELMELKRNLQTLEIELQSITAMVRENETEGVRYCSKTSHAGYFIKKGSLFSHPNSAVPTVSKPSLATPHNKWHRGRSLSIVRS